MASESIEPKEVIKTIFELFKFAFVTNCKIDEESMTEEEAKTLEELDCMEVLENFRDLVVDLLNFKKKQKSSDTAELA